MAMKRSTDVTSDGPGRQKVIGWLVAIVLLVTSANVVLGIQNQRELNAVQTTMQEDQATLEVRRFKAELRACQISQTTVRNERRIIKRSVNSNRRTGTLTPERLRFARATLRELKIPTCSPTNLGFPAFEPPNTPR
jgi:hypothetical protein